MAGGVITLGEMRSKGMTMLAGVSPLRAAWPALDRALIAEHGSGVLDLCAIIAADCPKMRNPLASIYDITAAECTSELPRWFSKQFFGPPARVRNSIRGPRYLAMLRHAVETVTSKHFQN
jgi:hypothetical protein